MSAQTTLWAISRKYRRASHRTSTSGRRKVAHEQSPQEPMRICPVGTCGHAQLCKICSGGMASLTVFTRVLMVVLQVKPVRCPDIVADGLPCHICEVDWDDCTALQTGLLEPANNALPDLCNCARSDCSSCVQCLQDHPQGAASGQPS